MQNKEIESKTIFVLGAGFTKAFACNSPVLFVESSTLGFIEIKEKYKGFKNIIKILSNAEDKNGYVNVEELMTRLSAGMPFDNVALLEGERKVLLEDIKNNFFSLINNILIDKDKEQNLKNFSSYIIQNSLSCVTFNYDTVLDKNLWEVKKFTTVPQENDSYFHPDGGYGFFCRPAEHLVIDGNSTQMDHCASIIYKLHGSLNWRIKVGSKIPYTVESLVHDEDWLDTQNKEKFNLRENDKETHLEKSPFIISPVLDKSEISSQSVLKVVWSSAYRKLENSDKIIFIGYSLPRTDIAAKFLFKESLVGKENSIIVVDYSEDKIGNCKKEYEDKLKSSYREVFPNLSDSQFYFEGALKWIEENCLLSQQDPVIEDLIEAK